MTCTNGVVTIEPDETLRLLVANFGEGPKRVVRNQTGANVLPHPRLMVPTHISTAEVLGIVSDEE